MAKTTKEVERIYRRAIELIVRGRQLSENFSFKELFNLVQDIANIIEQEYVGVNGLFKKKIVIEVVLDLYDKNKWDFAPKIPGFIERRLLKFVLNRGVDYVVEVLNKYVWKKKR